MKEVIVDANPLKSGMEFDSFVAVGKFLNANDLQHTNAIKGVMKHYCTWHKDKELNKIVIDEVFETVKPFRVPGYRYEIGQIITVNTGSYVIIDRYIGIDPIHKDKERKTNIYKCKCLIDNYEFELPESRIKFGIGCPICGNRKLIPGVRTLYDTHPEVLKYMVYPEQAKQLTPYSNTKVLCRCPFCGALKEIAVNNLVQYGFTCSVCSDHISYPNKFVREMLRQLNVAFIPEKSFSWSDSRLYDQYIEDFSMIIENHGLQHYEDSLFSKLESQEKNDEYKYNLAINNGIKHYIVIDCRESYLDWIKNSIMNSELPNLLGFSEEDVDWEKCDNIASTHSEIIKVCEAYKTNCNLRELAKIFKHNPHTISSYLEIGAKCGYCDFKKNDTTKNGRSMIWQASAKPIFSVTDNIYFMTRKLCEEYYKNNGIIDFNSYNLYNYINKGKPYKGKIFNYISKKEYNNCYNMFKNGNSHIKVIGDKYLDKYIKEE